MDGKPTCRHKNFPGIVISGLGWRRSWKWNTAMAHDRYGWNDSKSLARAMLHDRGTRRRIITRMLWAVLAWMAAGRWLVDGWLAGGVWRFLAWWGVCGVMALVLGAFALYDALAVIREEREKSR